MRLRNFPAHVVYGINDAVILDTWIRALERWALLAFGTALMLLLARQLARYIAAETLAKDRLRKMQTDLLLAGSARRVTTGPSTRSCRPRGLQRRVCTAVHGGSRPNGRGELAVRCDAHLRNAKREAAW